MSSAEKMLISWEELNLDYEGENKFASFFSTKGNIHTYPAKAVPEMVNELIKAVMSIKPIKTVLDPFVGSGTTALEAKYLGLDFWGSDLNPLAILLSKTKILTIDDTACTKKQLNGFIEALKKEYKNTNLIPVHNFEGMNYWFKEENIRELDYLRLKINQFIKENDKENQQMYALILLTAFSSTIRRVSLTRNSEFKLYRMSPNNIEKFSVNAIDEFNDAVSNLLDILVAANDSYNNKTKSSIYLENAKSLSFLSDKSIDMVITSPPYGDSKTTVAYGEFSRLSLQWMEDLLRKYINISIEEYNCDSQLLGGRKSEWTLEDDAVFYQSRELQKLESQLYKRSEKKEKEVLEAISTLRTMQDYIAHEELISMELLHSNALLYQLIYERVRLEIYRKINNSMSGWSDQKVKKTAKAQTIIYMKQLEMITERKHIKRQKNLAGKLDKVLNTLQRNRLTIKKRKNDVLIFLKDLYKAVVETDRVLKNGGFQVWIVGHRTVMGKIVINMEGILKDWFIGLGYECEASLNRKYSFKRLPHHINSTIKRCEEVDTMMNEYILVVRKK